MCNHARDFLGSSDQLLYHDSNGVIPSLNPYHAVILHDFHYSTTIIPLSYHHSTSIIPLCYTNSLLHHDPPSHHFVKARPKKNATPQSRTTNTNMATITVAATRPQIRTRMHHRWRWAGEHPWLAMVKGHG